MPDDPRALIMMYLEEPLNTIKSDDVNGSVQNVEFPLEDFCKQIWQFIVSFVISLMALNVTILPRSIFQDSLVVIIGKLKLEHFKLRQLVSLGGSNSENLIK